MRGWGGGSRVVKVERGRTTGREVGAAGCGGDRNENEREGGKTSKRKEERKMGEWGARNDEKEKKELGLGVGGAIRNYCGTIDKRRLRGRTTEDSLRPSDFSLLHVVSLFRLSSPLPTPRTHLGLSLPPSLPCLAHETFQTRQYVMFEGPRVTPLPPFVLRGIEDSFRNPVYFSEASKPRRDRSCKYTVLHDSSAAVTDMIMRQNISSALMKNIL